MGFGRFSKTVVPDSTVSHDTSPEIHGESDPSDGQSREDLSLSKSDDCHSEKSTRSGTLLRTIDEDLIGRANPLLNT
jgi:hypothetical protein